MWMHPTSPAEEGAVIAMQEALNHKEVVRDVSIYKIGKLVTGHKVLDANAAVQALLEGTSEHVRRAITGRNIKPYRLGQLLDYAIRTHPSNEVTWMAARNS